jgi:hypothetical protein
MDETTASRVQRHSLVPALGVEVCLYDAIALAEHGHVLNAALQPLVPPLSYVKPGSIHTVRVGQRLEIAMRHCGYTLCTAECKNLSLHWAIVTDPIEEAPQATLSEFELIAEEITLCPCACSNTNTAEVELNAAAATTTMASFTVPVSSLGQRRCVVALYDEEGTLMGTSGVICVLNRAGQYQRPMEYHTFYACTNDVRNDSRSLRCTATQCHCSKQQQCSVCLHRWTGIATEEQKSLSASVACLVCTSLRSSHIDDTMALYLQKAASQRTIPAAKQRAALALYRSSPSTCATFARVCMEALPPPSLVDGGGYDPRKALFLDLFCGDGCLGKAIMDAGVAYHVLAVDIDDSMRSHVTDHNKTYLGGFRFLCNDLRTAAGLNAVRSAVIEWVNEVKGLTILVTGLNPPYAINRHGLSIALFLSKIWQTHGISCFAGRAPIVCMLSDKLNGESIAVRTLTGALHAVQMGPPVAG